jgi:hypothetical protein
MPEPEVPVYQAARRWHTGEERIRTRWDRLKWWLGSLPGFDAQGSIPEEATEDKPAAAARD